MQRLLSSLLYLYLGGGFAYAWMSPLRPSANDWSQSAGAVSIIELFVALLIGPLLLAATQGRPPGLGRLLAPGAILLQGAAYAILYSLWQAESAPAFIGVSYAASVVLRTFGIAQGDDNALLDHRARMIIWFISIVLALFTALLLSVIGAALGIGGGFAPWTVSICGFYFLLLAAGEALLPYFRRNIDPRILPEDQIEGREKR